jgi:FkbM family methyltransferase
MTKIKNVISLLLQKRYRTSFSACGEDAILNYLFKKKCRGYYIDIGAFEPVFNSNTYLFYLKGWSGINIDANPANVYELKKIRPRDINIEAAISDREEILSYYEVTGSSSMNTFSLDFIKERAITSIKKEIKMKTRRLEDILDIYLPRGQEIDFMTIDVEGFEIKVLRSNNWTKYRAKVILLESLERMDCGKFDLEIIEYLNQRNYKIITKTLNGIIFVDTSISLTSTNQIAY